MSTSYILQIIGLILLFVGNLLVTDAVTRWGTKSLKSWKVGNLVQIVGFSLSLISIFMQNSKINILLTASELNQLDFLWVILGGIIGVLFSTIYTWLTRPRVINHKFLNTHFKIGYSDDSPARLYKLQIYINGFRNPGFCQYLLIWNNNSVFGNWDELPNPLDMDQTNQFRPELVPATYNNLLMSHQSYSLPIFCVDSNQKITIFYGNWFGRRLGYNYGPDLVINDNTKVKLSIRGNEFEFNKSFKIKDIINNSVVI